MDKEQRDLWYEFLGIMSEYAGQLEKDASDTQAPEAQEIEEMTFDVEKIADDVLEDEYVLQDDTETYWEDEDDESLAMLGHDEYIQDFYELQGDDEPCQDMS